MSWAKVCRPQSEGRLGIKDVGLWSQVGTMKNIWLLLLRSGSIWVAWVHRYLIQGRVFWTLKIPGNSSWCWRKILRLWETIRPFIKYKVGLNFKVLLWFDSWLPVCPLPSFCSQGLGCFPSIPANPFEGSILQQGRWRLPRSQDPQVSIVAWLAASTHFGDRDELIWASKNSRRFTNQSPWECLRIPSTKLNWLKRI